jgi:hypothetical protein
VGILLVFIPIAFVNTTAALLSWLVLSPIGFLINGRMPPKARAYFEE